MLIPLMLYEECKCQAANGPNRKPRL